MADGQTAALLRCALANATALGLDDTQVAALARMYWGEAPGRNCGRHGCRDVRTQFRETVSRFTEAPQQQESRDAEEIESAVTVALEKNKDRAFVETELATAAADKMLGWTKLFATFVALPVVLFLLILSLFGISKFEDLRRVSDQADALVTQARTKLAVGGAQVDLIREKIDKLTEELNRSQSGLEKRLTQVKQSNENLAGSVTNLTGSVTSLQLAPSGKSVAELQARLKELGFFRGEPDGTFGSSTVEAVEALQAKNGLPADGLVGAQTRALLFKS